MRSIKFAVSLLVLLVAGVLLSPTPTHAQVEDGFNIVTSPLPINIQAVPGTTVSTNIRIKNGATKTEKLKVSLMKFSAYGEEGKPSIAERAPGDDYFDWVSFSPQTFDAPSNQWINVKMTIAVPKTAAFGYYYAAVFSRASAEVPTSSKQNVLVGSTAVLVLLDAEVPGAKRTATISSFTTDKRFYEFLPTNFTAKVHNSGNVHLIPSGNIFISRGSKQIATLTINSAGGNVLPKSNRIFTVDWKDGFPVYTQKESNGAIVLDANDKPISTLRWDFSKISRLKFGHYTARLVMAYDNGTRDVPLEATVSFWVIPVRAIAIILIIPIVPSLIVYLFMRRKSSKRRFSLKRSALMKK